MHKLGFLLASMCAAFFALATPGVAAEPGKVAWSGAYVGVHGGTDITVIDVGVPGAAVEGLAARGFGYGVHAGIDHRFAGGDLVVGIGGEYDWSKADFKVSAGGAPLLTAGLDKGFAVTARLGLVMGEKAMPYVLAGWTRMDAGASLMGTPIGSTKLDGWIVGGGVQLALADNVFLSAEYRYTRFDDLAFGGGALTLDPDRHEVRAAVAYRFGILGQ